jgi:hypothetical protein
MEDRPIAAVEHGLRLRVLASVLRCVPPLRRSGFGTIIDNTNCRRAMTTCNTRYK